MNDPERFEVSKPFFQGSSGWSSVSISPVASQRIWTACARRGPSLAIYLLQGNLLFFNVDHVKGRLEEVIAHLADDTRWLIFDAAAIAQIDSTATLMLEDIRLRAEAKGLRLAIVDLHHEPLDTLVHSGLAARIGEDMIFDDLQHAVAAFAARG